MRFRAKGRIKIPKRNELEARYAQLLDLRLKAGEILWWMTQGWRFRLGEGAYYKPDFTLMTADGFLEAHETKGFWREAAKVRIREAAEVHPVKFVAVQWKNNNWEFEEF